MYSRTKIKKLVKNEVAFERLISVRIIIFFTSLCSIIFFSLIGYCLPRGPLRKDDTCVSVSVNRQNGRIVTQISIVTFQGPHQGTVGVILVPFFNLDKIHATCENVR